MSATNARIGDSLPDDPTLCDIRFARVCAAMTDQLSALHVLATEGVTRFTNDDRRIVVLCSLHAAIEILSSFMMHASLRDVRNSYVLWRAGFETLVNASYVTLSSVDVAAKAGRYMKQRSFRNLDRTYSMGPTAVSVRWQGDIAALKTAEINDAVNEYTTKKGKELTAWTDAGIEKKIDHIATSYGTPAARIAFLIAYNEVYSTASEVIHGSLYGYTKLVGVMDPGMPASLKQGGEVVKRHHCIFLATVMTGVIRYCCSAIADAANMPSVRDVLIDRYKQCG